MTRHSKLILPVLALAGMLGLTQASYAQTTKLCAAKWEEVDKNNDGKITIDEANDALKVKFNDVDKNADGVIAPDDYEACQKA